MSASLPLILVPGLACTEALFGAQIPALRAGRDLRVADILSDDSMAGMARRLLASLDGRFHLAGLSMGGYLALEVMAQAPERVASLCLMDTTARPDTPARRAERLAALDEVAAGRFEEVTEATLDLSIAAARADDAPLKQAIRDMARATGPDAFARQMRAIMGRRDSRPLLPRIGAPTLVIVGDEDRLTPPDLAREMAAAIPGARLEIVPGCGHMSTMERPELLCRLLCDWLAAQPA